MRRPFVPAGRSGLLILAFAAASIAVAQCKPLVKKIGEKLVEWGENLKKDAERTDSPASEESSSKAEVKKDAEEMVKSSSPTGKEEIQEQVAAANAPKATPPKPRPAAKKKAAPTPKAGTATNPKKPTKQ